MEIDDCLLAHYNITPDAIFTFEPQLPEGGFYIYVKSLIMGRKLYPLAMASSDSVLDVRRKLNFLFPGPEVQFLIFNGRLLDEDRTLCECNIQSGCTLLHTETMADTQNFMCQHTWHK